MPLSWNEIKSRALAFSRKWEGETSERAEAQSFWNDFFGVFGIERRRVAIFENQVKLVRAGEHLKRARSSPRSIALLVAAAHGPDGRLQARAEAELLQQVLDVHFDGGFGNVEVARDQLVR